MRSFLKNVLKVLESDKELAAKIDKALDHGHTIRLANLEGMTNAYREFEDAFPGAGVHYAMKSDDDLPVIQALHDIGAKLEINNPNELQRAFDAGYTREDTKNILYTNPHKFPSQIKEAYENGVTIFVSHSKEDIDKIAAAKEEIDKLSADRGKEGINVIIRLIARNPDGTGNGCGEDKEGVEPAPGESPPRFGVKPEEAIELLQYAKSKGLNPYGLCGHVGAGEENPDAWKYLIEDCHTVWKESEGLGINLTTLNLCGGFPAQINPNTPRIKDYGKQITKTVKNTFADTKLPYLQVEPGTAISDNNVLLGKVATLEKRGKDGRLMCTTSLGHYAAGLWDYDKPKIVTFSMGENGLEIDNSPEVDVELFGMLTYQHDKVGKVKMAEKTKAGDNIAIDGGGYSGATAVDWAMLEKPTVKHVKCDSEDQIKQALENWIQEVSKSHPDILMAT